MVATVRCEEIASDELSRLTFDERWLALEEAVQSGPVPGFGKKLSEILDTYLSDYDTEAFYFDEVVRKAKRQELESKALQLVSWNGMSHCGLSSFSWIWNESLRFQFIFQLISQSEVAQRYLRTSLGITLQCLEKGILAFHAMSSSAKALEPAFQGAGQRLGTEIWRIENSQPVPLTKSDHGKFYSGDLYIVLQTSPAICDWLFDMSKDSKPP